VDNKDIVKTLRETASFMELHGENEFKIRGYNNAIYNIERITDPLEGMSIKELENVNGIGKSIAARIHELIDTGKITILEDLITQTPEGVAEMMNVKGLGTKKIRSLWQELDITTIDQLQTSMDEGRLDTLKGFGGKVQDNIRKTIKFYLDSRTKIHFSDGHLFSIEIIEKLTSIFPSASISTTGDIRRKLEVLDIISLLVGDDNFFKLPSLIREDPLFTENDDSSPFVWRGTYSDCPIPIEIHLCDPGTYYSRLMTTTGSEAHMAYQTPDSMSFKQQLTGMKYTSEEEAYEKVGLPYIEPELREGLIEFHLAQSKKMPKLLEMDDLRGIIHNHSHYSDGRHSLREMAEHCKSLGYEYLGISDHSKAAAFYANGMDEDRVKLQQEEIEKLNKELAPFRIFKGIEADILPDGNLDYDPETLATFDFVVASVHSVLNMDLEKAMTRMMRAITNPFTTVLGHLTGRQLLIREGFPLDHKAIIDACAENGVMIEVNAHPYRLDLDWRWIPYALEKNVMLSINPDAHAKEGYQDMFYGVCAAKKGGLTADMTFNTKSMLEVEKYFQQRIQRAVKSMKTK
jgi:DNA polymerase (family 10)